MTLYKSFLCLYGNSLCQKCVVKLVQNEGASIRQLGLNYYKRNFTTTLGKESRRRFKNKKSDEIEEIGLENFENQTIPKNSYSLLVKPFFFMTGVCGVSFVGTAIWQYENVRKKALSLMNKNWFTDKIVIYGKKQYTWREEFNKKWNHLTEGQKLFVPICFVNVLVYLAWQVKKLQPQMMKYFCSTPFKGVRCLPMLYCTFSHCSALHLAANMYVLHTFSSGVVQDLGKEQFLGLYLTSAVVSSFTSYLYKVIRSQPGPSLGASGAVMGIIGYICSKYPDSKLSIIGLPSISFSAETGIKCIILLDIIGVLLGWKFMDHAAHLGGSFCGIAWCFWGNTYIWQKREPLLEWWHEFRTSK